MTEEGQIAQEAVDCIGHHGALFEDALHENAEYVTRSILELRKKLQVINRKITFRSALKVILNDVIGKCREYTNQTVNFEDAKFVRLFALRDYIGIQVHRSHEDYGCEIPKDIRGIIPRAQSQRF